MKKNVIGAALILASMILMSAPAIADDGEWQAMPVITRVIERAKGKLSLEWEGKAELYRIYVDGKPVSTVNIDSALIELASGSHQIVVVPAKYESKDVDTSVDISFSAGVLGKVGGSIDLASFGIDPKDLKQGTASDPFSVNYDPDPMLSAVPEILGADADSDNVVSLTFSDKYSAESYLITVINGKDVNHVEYENSSPETLSLIRRDISTVTIRLDPEYLRDNKCMIPEPDEKYGFAVRLKKHAVNLVGGSEERSETVESKDSKVFEYTLKPVWKNAPEITEAAQTADGEATLRWSHDDNGTGCGYKIIRSEKVLGVKTEKTEVGTASECECIIEDLTDGKYTYEVIPVLDGEAGDASEKVQIEIKNEWSAAPEVEFEEGDGGEMTLGWPSAPGVDSYHIEILKNSGSLLRLIDKDFEKYLECDVAAAEGETEYSFERPDGDKEIKLKIEVYGVHRASDGTEQKTDKADMTITLG